MIYIIYSVILFCFSWIEQVTCIGMKQKKYLIFLLSASWLAVSAIRCVMAGDYYSYRGYFYGRINTGSYSDTMRMAGYEPLYVTLMYVCRKISSNYAFFNFVTYLIVSVLQYFTVLYWCEEEKSGKNHMLMAYFIIWCLQIGNIFVIRQTISQYICLFSLRFIAAKKPGKFLLCVAAAAGFHISSLLFVLAYPVYWNRGSFRRNFLYMLLATGAAAVNFRFLMKIAITLLPETFSYRLSEYFEAGKDMKFSGSSLSYVQDFLKGFANVGVILLVCCIVCRFAKKGEPVRGYVSIYLLSCVFYIASLFYLPVLGRLAAPFLFTQIPVFLYSYRMFHSQSGIIWWNGVSVYMLARFTLSILSEYHAYLPFSTIFSM